MDDTLKKVNPFQQAGITLGLGVIAMLGYLVFAGTMTERPERPWVLACTCLIFYSMFNVVFSLGADNAERYWTQSILGFGGSVLGLGLLAWMTSGLGINDAGSFRWIFIVVTVSYLVFMTIARTMKFLVEFAQREEWNQPKLKKRNQPNDK